MKLSNVTSIKIFVIPDYYIGQFIVRLFAFLESVEQKYRRYIARKQIWQTAIKFCFPEKVQGPWYLASAASAWTGLAFPQ